MSYVPRFPSFLNSLAPPAPIGRIIFNINSGGTVDFSEPRRFQNGMFPPGPGIYAILVPDSAARPRKFRAIYFGQTHDANMRVRNSHERFSDWADTAYGVGNLFAAFCLMRGSSEWDRCVLERELTDFYHPVCDRAGQHSSSVPLRALLRAQPELY